ncbi:reverse transcriptase domain-containing protein [Comamonas thiooxydans]|uniref:reverse transcriptase domain-containing protein n=1 Tax=Comamonas thiooxydans TaxID=363952 RepID=UPI003D07E146
MPSWWSCSGPWTPSVHSCLEATSSADWLCATKPCKGEHVVQGALTSSYIATLCLHAVEGDLVKRLRHKGLVYTRLVDDITISSKLANYDFGFSLKQVEKMLHGADLPLNDGKTRIQYASMQPLIVHGLRVDFSQPRLPPSEPRNIRAAVKNLELMANSPGYRASRAYRRDFNRCMGRVNKLGRVKHNQHSELLARVRRVLPLPSHKDIERAERQVDRLEVDFLKPNYRSTYWFYKRYYVAMERLGILKRSFPKKAAELRARLIVMRPSGKYE